MFQLVIILMVVGIVALLIEALAPGFDGFTLGFIGVIALIVSGVLAVLFVPFGWLFVVGKIAVLPLTGYFLYQHFKRRQLPGGIILNDALAENLPQLDLTGLIGKEGMTTTLLKPYGEADFNGTRMEVTSGGKVIEKGTKVRVTEAYPSKIVVCAVNGN